MKRFLEGQDRSQVTLLPECLDDYIGEDNPVLSMQRMGRREDDARAHTAGDTSGIGPT